MRDRQLYGNRPDENRAAIELLRQAVSLDPTFAVAWSRLAWRYVWETRLGDLSAADSALALARHALDLDPDLPDAYYALASAYLAQEHDQAAIAQFERALELDPQHLPSLLDGGYNYSVLGQFARSLALSSRALPLSPNVPNTRHHVAIPLLFLGNDRRSEDWFRLAESEGMAYHRLDMGRITLDIMRGRSEAAVDQTLRSLERYSGEPEFELFAADALLFLGELEASRATLQRAFRLTPDMTFWDLSDRTWRTNYAFLLHQLGQGERAAELFDEALRVDRAAVEAGSQSSFRPKEIAAIQAVRGNAEEALEWLERAYHAGYVRPRMLAQDPMFASLRDDEGFQALLSRMERDVAAERARVEAEGIAAVVDSMIAAGLNRTR